MKKVWNLLRTLSVVLVLTVVLLVSFAGISGDNGTLNRLVISKLISFKTGTYAFFDKASFIVMGDSAYFSVGGLVADTSSFATPTGLFSKAIYVRGATGADAYVVTKRITLGVSTAHQTDTTTLSYMAKTDSLIIFRDDTTTSGLKFSWFRTALR